MGYNSIWQKKNQALCWTEIRFSKRRDFVVYGNFLVQLVSFFLFLLFGWFVLFFLFTVSFVKFFFVCKTPIQIHSCMKYFALFKKQNKQGRKKQTHTDEVRLCNIMDSRNVHHCTCHVTNFKCTILNM